MDLTGLGKPLAESVKQIGEFIKAEREPARLIKRAKAKEEVKNLKLQGDIERAETAERALRARLIKS